MKGNTVTVTEMTCASASERFNYLARRHDRGQHGVISTALRLFAISSDRTSHTLGVKHMIHKHIPSSMKKIRLYSCKISRRCTTTPPYGSAQNVSKTVRCLSTHSITHSPDHNKPPIEALSRRSSILRATHAQ